MPRIIYLKSSPLYHLSGLHHRLLLRHRLPGSWAYRWAKQENGQQDHSPQDKQWFWQHVVNELIRPLYLLTNYLVLCLLVLYLPIYTHAKTTCFKNTRDFKIFSFISEILFNQLSKTSFSAILSPVHFFLQNQIYKRISGLLLLLLQHSKCIRTLLLLYLLCHQLTLF